MTRTDATGKTRQHGNRPRGAATAVSMVTNLDKTKGKGKGDEAPTVKASVKVSHSYVVRFFRIPSPKPKNKKYQKFCV